MEYADNRLSDVTEEKNFFRRTADGPFLLLVLLLLTVGVIMVLSASFARAYYSASTGHNAAYYFTRQLGFAVSGAVLMLIVSRIPVTLIRKFSFLLYFVSVFFLVLVLAAGKKVNGARRWFEIAGITFQPSEIAKIGLILAEAELISRFRGKMHRFRYGVAPFLVLVGIVVGLLVLEPHLSASIIILAVTAVMMYLGGTKPVWFLGGGIGVGILGVAAVRILDYSSERITAWLDPFADTSDTGYQIVQSLYAIGSGGFSGLGLGAGRQKYLYLPEEHNDFIFSVICEELGFVGASVILILFAMLIVRGYWLAMHCRDRFSSLVCSGITTILALQVILNVAVVTNLVPCTGISLPFFSYGGTALLLQLGEMGIILSISRNIPEKNEIRPQKTAGSFSEKGATI